MNAHQRRLKRRREEREHDAWLEGYGEYLDSIAPDCNGYGREDLDVPCAGCQAGGVCDYSNLGHGSVWDEDPEDDWDEDDDDDTDEDWLIDQAEDSYENHLDAVSEARESRG